MDPTMDRRKYLRVMTEQLVSIGRLDEREGLAHALDLSLGGIRFQCVGLDVVEGEMLKVTLTLGERTATVVGQIKRVESLDEFTQEVALSFVKMEDSLREMIEEHLPEVVEEDADRREWQRTQLESVVSVSRANLLDVVAQAHNLSIGGLRFTVEGMEIVLGDILRVTLGFDGRKVQAVGQIVRVTEMDEFRQDVAMAFLEVDGESLEVMRTQLDS